eukprot:363185-Chlamydomonas_euryale.AAC.12
MQSAQSQIASRHHLKLIKRCLEGILAEYIFAHCAIGQMFGALDLIKNPALKHCEHGLQQKQVQVECAVGVDDGVDVVLRNRLGQTHINRLGQTHIDWLGQTHIDWLGQTHITGPPGLDWQMEVGSNGEPILTCRNIGFRHIPLSPCHKLLHEPRAQTRRCGTNHLPCS